MCSRRYMYVLMHTYNMLSSLHTACIYEAQQQVIVVGKQIFLLVSPHTEIMGVTQHIFYRLHLGFMNNFFFGFSCTNH